MSHRKWSFALFVFIAVATLTAADVNAQVKLTANFENGSGHLVEYDKANRVIVFKAAQQTVSNMNPDTRAVWFHFKLSGLPVHDTIILRYTYERRTYAPVRLTVSPDRKEWHTLTPTYGPGYADYKFKTEADSLIVATGYPYTYSDWLLKIQQLTRSGQLVQETLCKSKGGYDVPILTSRTSASLPKRNVFVFMGRQHAFESPSSYALEGFLSYLNSDDSLAKAFRLKADYICLPIMDVDKVILGGTGKDQLPQDMNRSWTSNSPWPQVIAAQKLIKQLDKNVRIRGFIDFHSPYPKDAKSTHYYNTDTVGSARHQLIKQIFDKYRKLEGLASDLKVSTSNYPPPAPGEMVVRSFMKPNYKTGFLTNLLFATTFEQAWDYRPDGKPYDQQALRQSGANLAKALIVSVLPKL